MKPYLDLLQHVLDHGTPKSDRTGTGTRSVFGYQMRIDLGPTKPGEPAPFPCLTTKKLHLRSIIHELLWFLKGDTNIAYLRDNGVKIWDDWADSETGELGPVYGYQWRSFPKPGGGEVDQITGVIEDLRNNPDSRRHIVCAWNPGMIEDMALPPCHAFFQFYVSPPPEGAEDSARGKLSCQLYQRSADVFLGVPFNVASYALLTRMVAQVCNLDAGEFIHTFGDVHLYDNHFDQAQEQLARSPRKLPTMKINPAVKDIFDFTFDDFALCDYDPYPTIKAPIAV